MEKIKIRIQGRQTGKTTTAILKAFEHALKNPGSTTRLFVSNLDQYYSLRNKVNESIVGTNGLLKGTSYNGCGMTKYELKNHAAVFISCVFDLRGIILCNHDFVILDEVENKKEGSVEEKMLAECDTHVLIFTDKVMSVIDTPERGGIEKYILVNGFKFKEEFIDIENIQPTRREKKNI